MYEQDPSVLAAYRGNNQTMSDYKLGNGFHTTWKCYSDGQLGHLEDYATGIWGKPKKTWMKIHQERFFFFNAKRMGQVDKKCYNLGLTISKLQIYRTFGFLRS